MPNLLIRDMPEEVFERLKDRAHADRRSMPAEAIHLLAEAITQEDNRRQHRQAMASIIERTRQKHPTGADSLQMLREDRER
jgi:plasmid stability protein